MEVDFLCKSYVTYPKADSFDTHEQFEMIEQTPTAEGIFIAVIFIVAMLVFVVMPIAAVAVARSGRKAGTPAQPKDELKPALPAGSNAPIFPEDAVTAGAGPEGESKAQSLAEFFSRKPPEDSNESGQRPAQSGFPRPIQRLNWAITLCAATLVAWLNYSRVQPVKSAASLLPLILSLSILAPTCLGIVWLRLTGTGWRHSLFLFLWVPVAFGAIWVIYRPLGFIIKYLSGQCC